jgi:hypothetical protein
MRYEKPRVMDLSVGARAAGQGPLGCYNGDSPGDIPVCATGTNPETSGCRPGGSPGNWEVCTGGSGAYACASGSGAEVSDTCQTGAFYIGP